MRLQTYILIALGLLAFISYNTLYVVQQTQQAIVLQFGEPKRTVQTPGLNWKIPFIQNVIFYENRVLSMVSQGSEQVILSDQKRLEVDTYARYSIVDPLKFYQTVRTIRIAQERLEAMVDSSTRRVLGNHSLVDILSEKRNDIISTIRNEVNASSEALGISILDVRIRRADYPDATSQNIFNRMKSEREREAKEFRATGEEEAQKIRATANKERTVLIAEARRSAEIIRGSGDSKSIAIYAEAFGVDEDFYSFYRSMQAYRKSFSENSTSMLLPPDSEFFRYFGSKTGEMKNEAK